MVHLTPREKQVLHYISVEMTNSQIADQLKVSKGTIAKYRRNLIWKFDCKNSVGVICKAYEEGSLPMKISKKAELLDNE